ncbi:MAG: Ig-like domain-containing protein [Kofleriaceae bacterium]
MWRLMAVVLAVVGCGDASGPSVPDALKDSIETITVTGASSLVWTKTAKLTATANFVSGKTLDVTTGTTWSSASPTVASIDSTGLLTAIDAGSAMVHATYNGVDGAATVTVTMPELAVSSFNNGGIDFFPANATGNVAPVRSIRGALTTLSEPRGLAVVGNELFVADQGTGSIDVFAIDATGNVAPLRRINGTLTTLSAPSQIAVNDTEIFIGDQSTSVRVFPKSGNGNVAPSRTISGPSIGDTLGVAVTATELFISNYGGSTITVVPLASSGTTTSTRTIAGPTTGISGPQGLLVVNGELFAAQGGSSALSVFDPSATGDQPPYRLLQGTSTMLGYPDEFAVLGARVYSANYSNSTVQVYDLTASGNTAPIATISGALTGISGDLGLVLIGL